MTTFYVNGQMVQTAKDTTLLRFLRDDLKLKSVKDGCSEGACGTCHVLIDGKPHKACVQKLSRMEGKHVVTVEGLTEWEKSVYVQAFGEAGAVQCGFCIPGMVISAKSLLDVDPSPTRAEAAWAIRNNICRCTGYKKIIDGILLAAKLFREGKGAARQEKRWGIGQNVPRIDVAEKVTGSGQYVDDVEIEGMVYASAVRSRYPRAVVKAIHAEAARALPGVLAVYTARDIPGQNKVGHLKLDWDTMIDVGDETHYAGDAICLVVAETPEILDAAKALVEVEYDAREPVTSPFEAMKKDAPKIHRDGNLLADVYLIRGDADKAIRESAYKVTKTYTTPWTEHAFLEPEAAIAFPFGDGVFIYSSDQGTYDTRRECAIMLGLDPEKVIVENKLVGGGFGGKEDVTVQHHAALAAWLLKRPVKVKLSRAESLLIHPKRHPMWMTFTTACDENGRLTGMKAEIIADTGAYASLGGPVLQRACTHAAGPYDYQNVSIEGKAYYTNNPPAGAFRGFGVTQSCFATECNLNLLAEMVGISPWEIRYRNAIRPGQELPNGQIADASTGIVETLLAVRDVYEKAPYAGIACAMKNAGVGVGLLDTGRCRLIVKEGKVHIHAGASGIGQGLGTILTQMVCESLNIEKEKVVYHAPNTSMAPDSGTTSGSRQTLVTGEACLRACGQLKKAGMTRFSGNLPDGDRWLEALEGEEAYGEYLAKTDPMGIDIPHPVSHVAYGYATQVCILDEAGNVEKIVAAHDVGRAIHPKSVEGQIEGGVVMGMGFALTESFPLEKGIPKAKFGTLGLFRAPKVPQIESVIVEKPGIEVACGAIGIGEITAIPTAPAIQGAYYALDGRFRTSLPLEDTPYSRKKS